MPRARLIRITVENFRSFVSKTTIEFPKSGNILINGVNLDTNGSSGSGKTNVVAAIAALFDFSPYSANDLQTWHSKKPWSVVGEVEVDSGVLVIGRGKKSSLSVNGVVFEGSSKQIGEQLLQLLGLSPEMLALLTYRGQKKTGLFLGMTDLEKKEFLTRLLALDAFESALEVGAAAIRAIEPKIAVHKAMLTQLVRQLDETPHSSVEDAKALLVGYEAGLDAARKQKSELEASIVMAEKMALTNEADVKKSYEPIIAAERSKIVELGTTPSVTVDRTNLEKLTRVAAEIKERLSKLVAGDLEAKQQLDGARSLLNRNILALSRRLGSRDDLLRQSDELHKAALSLAGNVCPTCEREWTENEAEKLRLRSALDAVEIKILELDTDTAKISELNEQLEGLAVFEANPLVDKFQTTYQQLRSKITAEEQHLSSAQILASADYQRRRAELQGAVDRALREAAEAGNAARQEFAAAISELRGQAAAIDLDDLREAVSYAKSQVTAAEQNQRTRDSLESRLVDEQALLDLAERELAAEKDFLLCIGRDGFLGDYFDEVLAEISDETNRILASVANTRHCTLRFTSEVTTQKGTTQKKITPLITVGEFEATFASGLSGGMQSVVELATDLAVGEVISRRSGACPGWLVLDECFEGLGAVEKESCIDILQTFSHDRLVLVIDHGSEFKSSFSNTIDIEFQSGKSRLAKKGQQ